GGLVALGIAVTLVGVVAVVSAARRLPKADAPTGIDAAVASACAVGGALVVLLVGRDLAATAEGVLGQIRLLHLFVYNAKRSWPASLDFSGPLLAFAVVGPSPPGSRWCRASGGWRSARRCRSRWCSRRGRSTST